MYSRSLACGGPKRPGIQADFKDRTSPCHREICAAATGYGTPGWTISIKIPPSLEHIAPSPRCREEIPKMLEFRSALDFGRLATPTRNLKGCGGGQPEPHSRWFAAASGGRLFQGLVLRQPQRSREPGFYGRGITIWYPRCSDTTGINASDSLFNLARYRGPVGWEARGVSGIVFSPSVTY
jgi:hypothetical protein